MKDTLIHITEPKYVFKFCPKCGESSIVPIDENGLLCKSCKMVYYINVASAVVGLICNKRNELLLVVRGKEPGKGLLDLPGGFVDKKETAEDALSRELMEELNLEVVSTEYVASFPNRYVFEGLTYFTLDIGLKCEVKSFKGIKADDDVSDYLFQPVTEIDLEKMAFPSIRQLVSTYIEKYA